MRIENEILLDFSDVLIRPKRSTLSSRKQVDLQRKFTFRNGKQWTGVPIIAANMDGVGTISMQKSLEKHEMLTCLVKHLNIYDLSFDQNWSPRTDRFMYSTGTNQEDCERVSNNLLNTKCEFICIDVANGYTQSFVDFIKQFREDHPSVLLMAGNVVTPEMTEELILAGVDIVKVGIGPGSVCTTRKMTGIGYPQLSAVIECADAAHGLKGHIIADGGCTVPGDVVKAFAAGADFVMLGGMLAGHKEGGASPFGDNQFYGMSSDTAMDLHNGGVANYRASEGKTVEIPYRGEVARTLQDILGGLRSACTYVGASELKELSKRTTFVRVTQQLNNSLSAYEI